MVNEPNQHDLRKILARLPDAPLPSNFTARVMQGIDLEERGSQQRSWNFLRSWHAFLPRVAVALVAVSLAGLTLQHHRIAGERAALAKNVAIVAETPMPSVDALKNFDAIKSMGQPARADDELLALLQ